MSLFFRKKKHSEAPSTLADFQLYPGPRSPTPQLAIHGGGPISSPSELAPQEEHAMQQPVCPWSAHAPPLGQSLSPLLRYSLTLSTSATAGELILFGGRSDSSGYLYNDLCVISLRDFSTTLLKTSGDVPSPRYGHLAVLTGNIFLVWGGMTDKKNDDSFYMLNFVSRKWTSGNTFPNKN